jgi:hypothetical protein
MQALEVLNQLLFGDEAPPAAYQRPSPGQEASQLPSPAVDPSDLHGEHNRSNILHAGLMSHAEVYPEDRVRGCWRCTLDDVEMSHDRPYGIDGKLRLPSIPPPGYGLGIRVSQNHLCRSIHFSPSISN